MTQQRKSTKTLGKLGALGKQALPKRRKRGARAHAASVGLPPGKAVYTGDAAAGDLSITRWRYSREGLEVEERVAPEAPPTAEGRVTWLDAVGVHAVPQVERLGKALGLHPLAIEDIVDPASRHKAEDLSAHLLLVVPMALHGQDPSRGLPIEIETLSVVCTQGVVVTFQEKPGDVFEPLRRRIEGGTGRIRGMQSDYLLFALLDAVVDGWFAALVGVEERVEALEEAVVRDGAAVDPRPLYVVRAELASLRRTAIALREANFGLVRMRSDLIGDDVQPYLRDLVDHTNAVVDLVDAARERAESARDLLFSLENRRMNDIMRVLTLFSTVFLPLSFLAGLYGMNFHHMPELSHPWGYPALLAGMAAVAGGMLGYFWRKGWFRS